MLKKSFKSTHKYSSSIGPINSKAVSMPAKASLALYIGKGGQKIPQIDFLNDIHAFNFQVGVYIKNDLPSWKTGN